MNERDKQAIDDLFQHLYQLATQGGPRDPEAEAQIKQLFDKGPPGLLYHMAQTLVGQRYALEQMRAQLAQRQQQSGRSAGFAPPWARSAGQPGYAGYGPPPYQQSYQPGWQRPGGSGFLAGAGQIALGVGGGILAAEALSDLFSGGPLFGGDRDDYGDRGDYDRGDYDRGDYDDRGDRGNYTDDGGGGNYTDDGNYTVDNYADDGNYADGGFDGGGFDGDQGGW